MDSAVTINMQESDLESEMSDQMANDRGTDLAGLYIKELMEGPMSQHKAA